MKVILLGGMIISAKNACNKLREILMEGVTWQKTTCEGSACRTRAFFYQCQ